MSVTCDGLVVGKCYNADSDIPRAKKGDYLGKFIMKEMRGSGDGRGVEADFSEKKGVYCNNYVGEPHLFKEVECKTAGGGKNARHNSRKNRRASTRKNTRRAYRR